jgi:hypothetical protein
MWKKKPRRKAVAFHNPQALSNVEEEALGALHVTRW